MEWQKELGWDGIHVGPSDKTVEATVLTLRFFIQNNECTSLSKMAKLYSASDIDLSISAKVFEVRELVNSYLDTPSNLSISESGPMTHREVLDLFVNGDLAHANNATTEDNYRSISQTTLFPLFQAEFTHTIRLFMLALNEIQRINCVALDQLRRGGTPPRPPSPKPTSNRPPSPGCPDSAGRRPMAPTSPRMRPTLRRQAVFGTNKLSNEPMDRNGPRIRQSNPLANKRTVDVGLIT